MAMNNTIYIMILDSVQYMNNAHLADLELTDVVHILLLGVGHQALQPVPCALLRQTA